jgi:acyl carrier protein
MTTTVGQKVHQYVVDRFLFGQDGDRLSHEASFLEQNLIDSTGVLELVAFIEEQYGITVNDDELIPDNLDSVSRIVSFVERKRAAAQVA